MTQRSYQYLPNSEAETKKALLQEIGVRDINELYKDVPKRFLLKERLDLPTPRTEYEVKRIVESLLNKNKTSMEMPIFLGAGCWPHYVPAVVQNIVTRSEFLTSYTPYQPEISQGILQALFEYQSMICELTEMEVANSSLYDWASALGEAARMAMRLTKRSEVLIPEIMHPERYSTLKTYVEPAGMRIRRVAYEANSGGLDLSDLKRKMSEKTATVYIENPSYLGFIETRGKEISEITHDKGALFTVGVDPISLGVLKPPGSYGADIVVGEGQPLGNSMNFGGPLLGIFACHGELPVVRQMPGRLVGIAPTRDGSGRGFCMVLQTREQHIRRQKATSNICSNEALNAVASAVYLALLGPSGLKELGETIMAKSNYAMKRLAEIKGVETPIFNGSYFKEFTVRYLKRHVHEIHQHLLKNNVHGGKDVSGEFSQLGEIALYCITEIHSKDDIDKLAELLGEAMTEGG